MKKRILIVLLFMLFMNLLSFCQDTVSYYGERNRIGRMKDYFCFMDLISNGNVEFCQHFKGDSESDGLKFRGYWNMNNNGKLEMKVISLVKVNGVSTDYEFLLVFKKIKDKLILIQNDTYPHFEVKRFKIDYKK